MGKQGVSTGKTRPSEGAAAGASTSGRSAARARCASISCSWRRWISEARAAGSGNGWASAGKGMTPAIAHIAFPPSPRHIAFIPA